MCQFSDFAVPYLIGWLAALSSFRCLFFDVTVLMHLISFQDWFVSFVKKICLRSKKRDVEDLSCAALLLTSLDVDSLSDVLSDSVRYFMCLGSNDRSFFFDFSLFSF